MVKNQKLTDSEKVSLHIESLAINHKIIVETIRKNILSTDKDIAEHIKWNNPSFYYTGEMKPFDPKEYKRYIVVMNLYKGKTMLVFPTGAKIKDSLLEGAYKDGRRLITFKDLEDVKAKEKALQNIIKEWLKQVEK
ncbi:DUF1801 domain-containing protein [Pedobacter lithocola]|uniref:DUF1801 domain-containing protein n=1 Tax=Pedobacter lithocola TaxID=1908239 RepID=A0ABV8PC13_9SPHI